MANEGALDQDLFSNIKQVIEQARTQVKQTINTAMVQAYWQIGRLIVEEEQQGQSRAQYGKAQLQALSKPLSMTFGKGFDVTNLRNMRRFYLAFEKRETLYLELSWSHYNRLSRIQNSSARQWYQTEAAEQAWSVRALERQIGAMYYERLLASKEKAPVEQEAQDDNLRKNVSVLKHSWRWLIRSLKMSKVQEIGRIVGKQMQEALELDLVIKQNLEVLGYGK